MSTQVATANLVHGHTPLRAKPAPEPLSGRAKAVLIATLVALLVMYAAMGYGLYVALSALL